MNGSNIPYHLRVKKDIERQLFIEQINIIAKYYDISEYSYIGMAGPFSSDFKVFFTNFDFKNFISYESDDIVFRRQRFNKPFSKITYIKNDIKKFVDDYPKINDLRLNKIVCWLDYTKFTGNELDSFKSIISKAEIGSIIKITLEAHASNLYKKSKDETIEQERELRLQKLKDNLGGFFNNEIYKPDMLTEKSFPRLVFQHLKVISREAFIGEHRKEFIPLSSYIYKDGLTMITFSGVIANSKDKDDFFKKTKMDLWQFGLLSKKDDTAMEINVPQLSYKEILTINSKLPEKEPKKWSIFKEDELKQYIKFYKYYPSYFKIV